MPSVCRISASAGAARNWAQLICTAGGTDTALSVGVYGLIYSYMFVEVEDTYKYIKVSFIFTLEEAKRRSRLQSCNKKYFILKYLYFTRIP